LKKKSENVLQQREGMDGRPQMGFAEVGKEAASRQLISGD